MAAGSGDNRRCAGKARPYLRLLAEIVVPAVFLSLILLMNGCFKPNSEPRSTPGTRSLSGSEVVTDKPAAPQLKVEQRGRQLVFSWMKRSGVDYYNLLESPKGDPGFKKIAEEIDTPLYAVEIESRPQGWTMARYQLEACNRYGCSRSNELGIEDILNPGIGYVRAGNYDLSDYFGTAVALSSDGRTMVAGAPGEDSSAQGTGGDPSNDDSLRSGAAYIFTYREQSGKWEEQAYLKATPNRGEAMFGYSVTISGDGTVAAAGAPRENDSTGAAYIFALQNGGWTQAGSLSPPDADGSPQPQFGFSVALSGDGRTLAVGAPGTNSTDAGSSLRWAGAVYLYSREPSGWQPAGRLAPDNPADSARFGTALAFSADGSILVAGAEGWNGRGAAFVFARGEDGKSWSQQAMVTPPGEGGQIYFGASLALSGNGSTLAVGAYREGGTATDQNGSAAEHAGAAYIYTGEQGVWREKHRLTPSRAHDEFGTSLALNSDGSLLAVGAPFEDSKAVGLDGDENDQSGRNSGAAYLFAIDKEQWQQIAYIKPIDDNDLINERFYGEFGATLSISRDSSTLAVGAPHLISIVLPQRGESAEAINATSGTGIAYLYSLPVIGR